MAEGRQRSEWERAAASMALIANIHRKPKAKAFKAEDFNPYVQKQKRKSRPIVLTKEDIANNRDALAKAYGCVPPSKRKKKRKETDG